jgi:predicted phosphate transport protein (TIGR00153 family)
MGLFKKFVPRTVKFYDLLSQIISHTLEAANLLNDMLVKWENKAEYASRIHILENKCDDLTHNVIRELNETFITPIDREDIHELVNSLDNIMDSIDAVASRIHLYKVKNPIEFSHQLCDILRTQIKLIDEIIKDFEESMNAFDKLVSVRNYETQGDKVFREAISNLFDKETDIVELIKKKEILELMEKAVDRCQTVTIVIEGIFIKNA